jgi:hypothetical protein
MEFVESTVAGSSLSCNNMSFPSNHGEEGNTSDSLFTNQHNESSIIYMSPERYSFLAQDSVQNQVTATTSSLPFSSSAETVTSPNFHRRDRSSSFNLPSTDLFLSIFRTPSRSSKSSPANQERVTSPPSSFLGSSSGSANKEADMCAICLSPLNPKKRPTTRTSCQHNFHRCCLQEAKQNCRSECPLCRSVLSPVAFLRYSNNGDHDSQANSQNSSSSSMSLHNMRGAVVAAAARGREAVRRAMSMRAMNNVTIQDESSSFVSVATS